MTRFAAVLVAVAILTSACTRDISPTSYSVGAVGEVNRVVRGQVVSVRPVRVDGTRGVGSTTGIAAGAVAGSSIGGGARANLAGAIGGAVVGGLIGAAIEKNASQQMGLEYVVETTNGSLITLVQGTSPSFAEGEKVLVMYGAPSRIIADPSAPIK